MKRGTLRLYGPVAPGLPDMQVVSARGVASELDRLREEGVDALDVYLSSDGGDVSEGLAVYEQINRFPGDVTVRVDGRALSIASAIALSGKRLVMPRSAMLMVHGPWRITAGPRREHERALAMLDAMGSTMRGIYARKTGLSAERVQTMMDDETWLTAEEAKALGFADQLAGDAPSKAKASGDSSLFVNLYRNTPADLRTLSADAALAKLEGLLMRQRMTEIARGASAAATRLNPGGTPKK